MEHEKKIAILNYVKNVEENAKKSLYELEDQKFYLRETNEDLNKINKKTNQIDENLNEINFHRKSFFASFCCCTFKIIKLCNAKSKNKEIKQNELRNNFYNIKLTKEQIEKGWCMRFNPEDKWFKLVELGLDHLLDLAEQMKRNFDEQNELAEKINLNVNCTREKINTSKNKMKLLQNN